MKKPTKTTPALVLTPAAPVLTGGFTIGLDLGDRNHYVCALDATGQIIHEGPIPNDRVALALLLAKYPVANVALAAGTHSPWISRFPAPTARPIPAWVGASHASAGPGAPSQATQGPTARPSASNQSR